jgi:hypothetical protein
MENLGEMENDDSCVCDIPTGLTPNVKDGILQRFTVVVCASGKRNARRSNLSHKCEINFVFCVPE